MSQSSSALALRYRPFRFEGEGAPVAQTHVTRALKNAVRKGRVAQAYIFCGPHGVGKTTLARVLAAALNCPGRGEDGEPCGTCPSCEKIRTGSETLDVRELDAASNGGVENARELRGQVMYSASEEGRYKVYILDEAHMLSTQAWNALLKTLEEPPARVIFVFATTEIQKIADAAPPVLSRCQRFDFHSVPMDKTIEHLKMVAEREQIEIGEDALVFIARKAGGAMRDALSLLDQVLTYAPTGEAITAETARESFGLLAEDHYINALGHIATRKAASAFETIRELRSKGGRYEEFYRNLWRTLHDLLGIQAGVDPEGWTTTGVARLKKAASVFRGDELLAYLGIMRSGEEAMRTSHEPDLVLCTLLLECVEARGRFDASAAA